MHETRNCGGRAWSRFIARPLRPFAAGSRDADEKPTIERYIAHAREPGNVYWREPDLAEVQTLKRKGAQELPEVFKTDDERRCGLSADVVMERAAKAGFTKAGSEGN